MLTEEIDRQQSLEDTVEHLESGISPFTRCPLQCEKNLSAK